MKLTQKMISVISTIKKAGFMSKNKDMREAFTFIELLLVVTIAAVLAAMVVPNLKITHSNLQLDNFVKDIYYLAKYLQISSVSQSCIYRLDIVQTTDDVLFVAKCRDDDGEFVSLEGALGKAHKVPQNIDIYSIEPVDRESIFFYPDASIDATKIVFKNKTGRETVLVLKQTGTAIQIK